MSDALNSPTAAQYAPTTQVTGTVHQPPADHQLGTLPFTGLDVAVLVIIALGLCLAGLCLRALSKRPV